MSASALRNIACAGALATGLMLGGPCFATAAAQTGDSTDSGGGVDGASAPDSVEGMPDVVGSGVGGDPSGGSPDDNNQPVSTVGNGRNDVVDPNAPIEAGDGTGAGAGRPASKYQPLLIPMLRIPTFEEFAAPGWTPPSAYFTILEVPFVSLGDVLAALSQPEPEPTPSPAFRTQEEAPVADATPTSGGGAGDRVAEAVSGPPVFEAPLVVAPRIPTARGPREAPVGASAPRAPLSNTGAGPEVAGARTPLIRGSLSPSAPSVARPLTPISGEATRVGYPRYLRNPTAGELSLIALPGVAGLMFLTFSGGVIGYRQANSARFIRTGAARFLEQA